MIMCFTVEPATDTQGKKKEKFEHTKVVIEAVKRKRTGNIQWPKEKGQEDKQ